MLIIMLVVIVMIIGPFSFLSHPSREDPAITIRTAVVTASYPGMSPERIENLITRKMEEKAREMPEIRRVTSTSRSGQSTVKVELLEKYYDLGSIWQDLRNKMGRRKYC